MVNRLIHETSPYLRQHAQNPVDWYPWGEEAFNKAVAESKPILLSIGYSACHWCHVMERESFEDNRVAEIMNKWFVNIKVDREERPDVDSIYMYAVQSMTGSGGWPLTVFLTSERKPFFGGTYFPPIDRHGLPSFTKVLTTIGSMYREDPPKIAENAEQVISHIERIVNSGTNLVKTEIGNDQIEKAVQGLKLSFDKEYGGLGTAPKFPQPLVHEFILQYADRFNDQDASDLVFQTLDAMSEGGIYDQIGGGFHRYSTDRSWLVPHFEKMLYDNALLSRLYLNAYRLTGKSEYKIVVEETLDYILREMTDQQGGFFSAQDADSEGVEGKYFIWTKSEIMQELGQRDGEIISLYYGITDEGNFDGSCILHQVISECNLAARCNISTHELNTILAKAKAHLLGVRSKRIPPERDDKIITSWNGFMIRSFAEAGATFQNNRYSEAAVNNATFLLKTVAKDHNLARVVTQGLPKGQGYLEDYAALIDGLLAVYQTTLNLDWLIKADNLAQAMIKFFWDPQSRSFYDTGINHEKLVVRPRDYFDNAVPCGTSLAANVLLRLAAITSKAEYLEITTVVLERMNTFAVDNPFATSNLLRALDFWLTPPSEIVLVGTTDQLHNSRFLYHCYIKYTPNTVIAGGNPDHNAYSKFPLLADKVSVQQLATAYVCSNYTCSAPITTPEELENYPLTGNN